MRIIFPQVNVRAVDSSLSAVGDPLYATMDTLRHLDLGGRTGWALVVRRFDETFAADPDWARGLSEVVARASYEHLLMGGRFLMPLYCPVELLIGMLGGAKPAWFTREPWQMHLDLAVDDLDEAQATAIRLGACGARTQPAPDEWRVFFDSVGHRSGCRPDFRIGRYGLPNGRRQPTEAAASRCR